MAVRLTFVIAVILSTALTIMSLTGIIFGVTRRHHFQIFNFSNSSHIYIYIHICIHVVGPTSEVVVGSSVASLAQGAAVSAQVLRHSRKGLGAGCAARAARRLSH